VDVPATILVLRKTKLGETDLIITALSDEGRQVRAVVKGARKPGSRLGAHLELYSIARVLLHKGRNLDIVTEASGVEGNEPCRADLVHSAAAAVVVELIDKASADGVREERLFPLAREALRCIGTVPDVGVALISAAALLKVASQLGFRPSLTRCVFCGDALLDASSPGAPQDDGKEALAFSFEHGGVVCSSCLPELTEGSYSRKDARFVFWAEVLITGRFVDLERYADEAHAQLARELLLFSREWIRFHLVNRLKSLDFLLAQW
jgi:DNA repair protein RecO (recombination protein O)